MQSKIKNPLEIKGISRRDHLNIRFVSDEQQDIIYEYDRFVEQKILEHKNSKKNTPKPKVNDFYARALIRGIKYDLFDNKSDEIANIAANAVTKVLAVHNDQTKQRQNIQTVHLAAKMEYITNMLNYLVPILQSLAPEYFDLTSDPNTGYIKNLYLQTPIGFEEMGDTLLEKWRNKIKKDSSVEKIEEALFKEKLNT